MTPSTATAGSTCPPVLPLFSDLSFSLSFDNNTCRSETLRYLITSSKWYLVYLFLVKVRFRYILIRILADVSTSRPAQTPSLLEKWLRQVDQGEIKVETFFEFHSLCDDRLKALKNRQRLDQCLPLKFRDKKRKRTGKCPTSSKRLFGGKDRGHVPKRQLDGGVGDDDDDDDDDVSDRRLDGDVGGDEDDDDGGEVPSVKSDRISNIATATVTVDQLGKDKESGNRYKTLRRLTGKDGYQDKASCDHKRKAEGEIVITVLTSFQIEGQETDLLNDKISIFVHSISSRDKLEVEVNDDTKRKDEAVGHETKRKDESKQSSIILLFNGDEEWKCHFVVNGTNLVKRGDGEEMMMLREQILKQFKIPKTRPPKHEPPQTGSGSETETETNPPHAFLTNHQTETHQIPLIDMMAILIRMTLSPIPNDNTYRSFPQAREQAQPSPLESIEFWLSSLLIDACVMIYDLQKIQVVADAQKSDRVPSFTENPLYGFDNFCSTLMLVAWGNTKVQKYKERRVVHE
ncbi:hypothetical protein TREMEDRAFT_74963 [Tremella mesenterica DSM 1558]|uniref:uncharacterized protein n=1 Tax=Tremella mesenterica (strain ATCC 24925 / CBS 8224 / DSM 1558 / NBRC 9311 / NRRL Y-6157 / RJB 2259-6 / UBC 559-6) TaxID=578456 RepID=UPI00032C0E76|nr:uncharacterized protein TREMEDRAFT_74963 [Tremella mesenterica DSM 1558]EIW65706.1 hypothetical protein TREMEDRAFT_74963 [Tremella mesenterica DSM 1558]